MTRTPMAVLGPGVAPRWAPLVHVLLAGGLGVLTAVLGFPLLVGAGFSGDVVAALAVVAATAALASCLAVALDRGAGPGRYRRFRNDGSTERGVALGVLGTLGILLLAFVALAVDLDDLLPNEALFALTALPFLVVAALQWPGVPRVLGVLAVVGAAGLALVLAEELEAAVRAPTAAPAQAPPTTRTERAEAIGLDRRPWAADLPGHHVSSVAPGQLGGVYVIYTADDPATGPEVMVSTLGDDAVPADDPCAAPWVPSPVGAPGTLTCTPLGPGVWQRTGTPDVELDVLGGRDVIGQRDGRWIAVSGGPDAPLELLQAALATTAPMTDEQLDEHLTSVGHPP